MLYVAAGRRFDFLRDRLEVDARCDLHGLRAQQAERDPQGGGLSGAVGADEAVELEFGYDDDPGDEIDDDNDFPDMTL